MRVLITNTVLDLRGGSESFVRDLARGLQRLGHSVLAYSSDQTQRPRLLENDVMPVATDLDSLPFLPDVIHAQHHLDAMTALASIPGVPALYHCHGAVWRETTPKHPRIYHYAAVSATLADRIAIEAGIPPADITVLLNGVDVERFRAVRTLPDRPARALFFNGRHPEGSDTLAAVRQAASSRGLHLDVLGRPFGGTIPEPEHVLPGYDIVFASGRSAIEAMACGCAVVVLGRTSCGGMVHPSNFDRYRQANFTIAVNSPPPSAIAIAAELDRFSRDTCSAVTARVRQEADSRLSALALVSLYEAIIERHRAVEPDLAEELRATSRYLRTLVPLVKMTDRMLDGQWSSPTRASSFDELRAQVGLLQQRLEKAR